MSAETVHFGFVVEGEGEVEAVPLLTRRICHEVFGVFAVRTARPVRMTRSRLVRTGEMERAIQLAWHTTQGSGRVVVLIDADDDCPAELGPKLKVRARDASMAARVAVVLVAREFETWFVAAARSLAGKRGLRAVLEPPKDPEGIRGAKEWLNRNMAEGKRYSPTIDQAALLQCMDLTAARRCGSFERLCRDIGRLLEPR